MESETFISEYKYCWKRCSGVWYSGGREWARFLHSWSFRSREADVMNEHRVREGGVENAMYKILSKAKQIPFQSQVPMLLQTWLSLASRLWTMEFFDSFLPLTIFYIPLVTKTFHVFSPGAGPPTLAFLLSPYYLVLTSLLLQVASWFYLGMSRTSYRRL